eukprot:TRINITY_DN26632_c0_g1_i1.p1 TRINITY_DN26632_c0_g1~~TRINITY_DN26632_c0_g1_i1.p1  ORF type:complete len:541 (+),score=74.84 TRINITY_DN26632_c0_g1_i1:74-1624(+)
MPSKSRIARFAGEFIGVYCLVLAVGLNILYQSWLEAPFGIACAMICISGALMNVSGAHLNPAISFAVFAANRLPFAEFIANIVIQMSAGLLGAITYTIIASETFELAPPQSVSWKHAGVIEEVFTFMICFVALNVTLLKRQNGKDQFAGIAIALVFVAVGYSAGHIVRGGGWCNPAIAFGIDIANAGSKFQWCLVYLGFQGTAAILAALLFHLCRPDDHIVFWKEVPSYPLLSKCLSELTGTFLLVFTVGLGIVSYSDGACLANGAVLASLTFALFSCSGAHFNPAVTIAVLFRRWSDFGVCTAFMYIISQVLGGICAAFLLRFADGGIQMSVPQPQLIFQLDKALWAEGIFTFLFCVVYLRTTRESAPLTQMFGLVVGASYAGSNFCVRWISGGVLNPAVSWAALATHAQTSQKSGACPVAVPKFGKCPSEIDFQEAFRLCFAYTGAQLTGATVAVMFTGILDLANPMFVGQEEPADDEEEQEEPLKKEDEPVADKPEDDAAAAAPVEAAEPTDT